VFRDCAKPGVLSYGLTIIPFLFQSATRSLALTALGGDLSVKKGLKKGFFKKMGGKRTKNQKLRKEMSATAIVE
jgi:hypothetical protein